MLFTLSEEINKKQLRQIALRATAIGLSALVTFAYIGSFLLQTIFHIKIFSLQIAGGIILFLIGLRALQKGEFFERGSQWELKDIAAVPIASPMIAGPATITASISQSVLYSPNLICISIFFALALNLVIMLLAVEIGNLIKKYNLMGPLIRITGLFIASIGVNMVLTGLKKFLF